MNETTGEPAKLNHIHLKNHNSDMLSIISMLQFTHEIILLYYYI